MAFHKEGIRSTILIGLLESVCKSVTRKKKMTWFSSHSMQQCHYKVVYSTIGLLESVCKSVTYSFEGTFPVLLP